MICRHAELYGPWVKEKSSKLMVMVYKPFKVSATGYIQCCIRTRAIIGIFGVL